MNEFGEFTIGDIYEEIAEMLATARTKALTGHSDEALNFLNDAHRTCERFKSALEYYPGFAALQYAFAVTAQQLGVE